MDTLCPQILTFKYLSPLGGVSTYNEMADAGLGQEKCKRNLVYFIAPESWQLLKKWNVSKRT